MALSDDLLCFYRANSEVCSPWAYPGQAARTCDSGLVR